MGEAIRVFGATPRRSSEAATPLAIGRGGEDDREYTSRRGLATRISANCLAGGDLGANFEHNKGPKGIHGGGSLGFLAHPCSHGCGYPPSRQLAHLDRHLHHLWGANLRELGFRAGWCKEESGEVSAAAEEWPRVGIGGGESWWRGTIRGDTRRFAKIVRARPPEMAHQGGGWRGRFQPRPAFQARRPAGQVFQGKQGQAGGGVDRQYMVRGEGSKGDQAEIKLKEGSLLQKSLEEKDSAPDLQAQEKPKDEAPMPNPPPQANPKHGMNQSSQVTQRTLCLRCKGLGHMARDCPAAVFYTNCAKPTHRTEDCLYDK